MLLVTFQYCDLVSGSGELVESVKDPYYCSFFNNRAPKPQSNLFNCTWFRVNSCCVQEEIDETFGQVKTLPGASPACQKYTNYLMCYICHPEQNTFYLQGYLTVCEEFCNAWYHACGSAILKGSMVKELYKSGEQFCKSRSYKVKSMSTLGCFFFDKKMIIASGETATIKHYDSRILLASISSLLLVLLVL